MKRLVPSLAFLAIVAIPLAAQQEGEVDLRQEVEALKRDQAEMQKQLDELRQQLAARPATPARPPGPFVEGKVFALADNAVEGEPSARLTQIDFTDYQ